MIKVYLGLGSNVDAAFHLRSGLDALQVHFGALQLAPVYESEAVGFDGENFLNTVVQIETDCSVGALLSILRDIENASGRDRNAARFSARTLDIDILCYGGALGTIDGVHLPRDEIVKNAFVLRPLADLAPGWLHPGLHKTASQLWAEYQCDQRLWPIDFKWQGMPASKIKPD